MRGAAKGGLPLTTVIVSQRVSTVRDADVICVLDHGSVAGLGTHDELYATCRLYREICSVPPSSHYIYPLPEYLHLP